jgi:hypothetical protein
MSPARKDGQSAIVYSRRKGAVDGLTKKNSPLSTCFAKPREALGPAEAALGLCRGSGYTETVGFVEGIIRQGRKPVSATS